MFRQHFLPLHAPYFDPFFACPPFPPPPLQMSSPLLLLLQAKGWLPNATEASIVQQLTQPKTGLKRDGDLKSSSQVCPPPPFPALSPCSLSCLVTSFPQTPSLVRRHPASSPPSPRGSPKSRPQPTLHLPPRHFACTSPRSPASSSKSELRSARGLPALQSCARSACLRPQTPSGES
jgi:hypothetical protein